MVDKKINDLTLEATINSTMQLETDIGGITSNKITIEDLKTYIGTPPKITRYTAGSYTFTPDPLAKKTKIEIQAAGGSGGRLYSNYGTCSVGSGGNSGNFYSCMIEEPITTTLGVTVGGTTGTPGGNGAQGNVGAHSFFGSTQIVGGGGGIVTYGTAQAVIIASSSQPGSAINWGSLSFTELLNITGQKGTSPWVPRQSDYGHIVGGDGGEAHWGHASRSEVAIYSASRGGYASVNHDGSGYGYGGCGFARGGTQGGVGNYGGAGLTIVTEYY